MATTDVRSRLSTPPQHLHTLEFAMAVKRRRRTDAVVAQAVLLQPHLLTTIVAYQYGLFQDLKTILNDWRATNHSSSDVFFVLNQQLVFLDPVSVDRLHAPLDAPQFLLHLAIHSHNLHLCHRWLACSSAAWTTANTLLCAAAHGSFQLVKLLHEGHHLPCTAKALEIAAASGYTDIVHYLHDHLSEPCTWRPIYKAAESGHTEIVRWLSACANCRQFAKCAADYASTNTQAMVQQAEMQATFATQALVLAVAQGHQDVLCFLLEQQEAAGWADEARNTSACLVADDVLPTVDDSLDFLMDHLDHGIVA
ncbi:unnamed protein product [Aphanomyces euteiches]|nr:hypothetical protein AeRB84_011610 [Aphanomyces euteiches]